MRRLDRTTPPRSIRRNGEPNTALRKIGRRRDARCDAQQTRPASTLRAEILSLGEAIDGDRYLPQLVPPPLRRMLCTAPGN